MATKKGNQAQKNKEAARVRATASCQPASARKAVNTHPRTVALAVTTAFMPWFVPFTVHAQAQPPAPNTTPTLQLTSPAGSGYVHAAQGAYLQVDQYASRAAFAGTIQLGADAHMNVVQPNSAAVALFKDTSGQTSQIWGRVTANGHLFFSNSAGVLFGRTAAVSAGSLVATTLSVNENDLNDPNALRIRLSGSGASGRVENYGTILTPNGYTALIAPQVVNDGIIVAHAGTVALAAADRVSLDLIGDGLISINVEQAAMNASILNSGSIEANGGQVLLTARSANALLDTVINSTGVIRANSLVERNGEIVLDGGGAGVVLASGTLDAAGREAGTSGGAVKVLGQYVGLVGEAQVDVSGDAGGGTALIGGNFQGKGPEQNATATFVGRNAKINADARGDGDGGTVIVWADDATRVYGTLSARGGARGGDGGFIETSGKNYLELIGATVDASSPLGRPGTWLLDPRNVTIADTPGDLFFDGGSPNVFTPTADDAVADRNTIEASLNGGTSVTITTGASGSQDGDITVQDTITKSAGGDATLLLTAADDIFVNAAITSTAGRLHVTLTANDDATGAGSVFVNQAITTNGGNLTATGVAFTATAGLTTTGANGTAGGSGAIGGNVSILVTDGNITTTTIDTLGGNGDAAVLGNGGNGGAAGSVNLEITAATTPRVITAGAITAQGGNGGGAGTGGDGGAGGAGGAVTVTGDAANGASLSATTINTTGGTGAAGGLTTVGGAGGAGGAVSVLVKEGVTVSGAITTSGGNGGDSAGLLGAAGNGGNAGSVSVTSQSGNVAVNAITSTGGTAGNDNGGTPGVAGNAAAITLSAAANVILSANISGGAVTFNIGQNSPGTLFIQNAVSSITGTSRTVNGGTGTDTVDATRDTDMTLTDTSLDVSAAYTLALNSVERANLTGGATGNNLDASAFTLGPVRLDGQGGADTLSGGSGNDTIIGGAGADTLSGGDGDDTFVYGAMTDLVSGGVLVDTIDGGNNTDTIQVNSAITLATTDSLNGLVSVERLAAETQSAATRAHSIVLDTNAQLGTITEIDLSGDTNATSTGVIDLTGTSTAMTLRGVNGGGSNNITAGSGADSIFGGIGSDTITGAAGTDTMNGGDGSDVYLIASSADHTQAEINDTGTTGTDEVRFMSTTAGQTLTIFAGDIGLETVKISDAAGLTAGTTQLNVDASQAPNALTIIGNDGNNSLAGTAFADTIDGNAGLDTITGAAGADTLSGGDGNDTFVYGATADLVTGGVLVDTIDGGNNTDTIQVNAAITLATTDSLAGLASVERLAAETQSAATRAHSIVLDTNPKLGTITEIDLSGDTNATSTGNIDLTGTSTGMTLRGVNGAGANTITAGSGADSIFGGSGSDTISGAAGADSLSGGDGDDTFVYGAMADLVTGGVLVDTIDGGNNADTIQVNAAITLATTDSLNGLVSVERLAAETQSGATRAHSIVLDTNAKLGTITEVDLSGDTNGTSTGNVDLTGTSTAMTLRGVNGGGSNTIIAGSGNDTIVGGLGADTITAAAGADSLSGGDGNDTFVYGAMADLVTGGVLVDTIDGGNNTDTIQVNAAITLATTDSLAGLASVERLAAGTQSVATHAHSIVLDTNAKLGTITEVDLSGDTNGTSTGVIDLTGTSTAMTLRGVNGGGANTITAGSGADSIFGGSGSDTITGAGGTDSIVAGDGDDTLVYTSAEFIAAETVNGGNGTDQIRITDAASIADAQFANKTFVETLFLQADAAQSVTLAANAQAAGIVAVDATSAATGTSNVTVDASAYTVAITINTGAGADTISSGTGNDTISSGAGADVITSGAGNDSILAGDGADSIRFTNANFAAADTVDGGNQVDEIRITDAATITDARFANKTLVETLFLVADATQSVTLAGNSDTAGITTVDASSAVTGTSNITVNAGGRTNAITITTGAGADTITGGAGADNISSGAGNDSIQFANANFTSADTVAGGLGVNEIRITDAAAVVDADFTSVTDVQTLVLAADATQSATLAAFSDAAGIVTVDATAAVTGTSNVTVDASGRLNAITISTGAGADTITGGADLDNISAGDGDDSIRFTNARFVAGETVNGGNGTDEIRITDAASIADAQFANKTNVETLFFAADAAQSATLGASSQAAGIVTVDATSAATATSNVTVDASVYTVAIAINTGAGADTITGGAAADNISAGDGNDSIRFTNARFVAGETVNGGNGTDEIRITDAATITDAQFANKTNVETLLLVADAVQNVTLAGISDTAGIVTVDATSAVTGSSNITVDASGRANAIAISTGAGADTITGGAAADNISAGDGNDSIRFTNARFVAGETVNAGNGTDEIRITDAATIADGQFANKSNAETLFLAADAAQSVTLAGNSDAAGIVTVDASSAVTGTSNVTVNAGGRANAITITTGAGADSITGGGGDDNIAAGTGNDSIRFADAAFTSGDTVAGGGGANEIRITDGANVVDADFTSVTNVQTLVLAADAAQSATLAANAQAAGVVTVDATSAVSGTSNVTVNASVYTVAITISSGAGADVLTGGTGNDTLNAGAGNDTLTGGAGADVLNGGGGANVVSETRDANFVLTDTTLDIGAEGTDTLAGIGTANLTGGASNNSFTVSGWTGFGTMDGAGGAADTIIASNDVNFTLTNASLARSGGQQTLTLANMESATLTGGGGANAFVLSGWTGSGSMTGNGGIDTLTGPDTANTWNVTGAGSGNINGSVNFTGFTNLAGGSAADNFVFANGVVLAGTLSGGTGTDTLNLSAYNSLTSVTLTASTANGYSGTVGAVTGGFSTIDVLSGSATSSNTLTGMNTASTWTSTGLNSGTYTTGGNTLTFSNFRNWAAGSGADTFLGANIGGNLSDGGGATSLSGAITTTGTQNYIGAVALIGDTVASSSGITFNSTLDGGFNFTSNNAGTNTFMGAIGSNTALASITTDAPGFSTLSGNVTATGAISFLDVTSATGITMTSTGGGAVNVNNATATSPAVVSTTGNVTFQGTQIGTAGTPLVFIVTPSVLTLTQQAVGFFSGPSLPGSMVFPNGSSITFNNAQIAQSFLQQQATTAASNASQAVTAAIVEEANKTFGTDSVAEDVEYGFAGEVGTTPPMDHRIDESGISVPRCVQESREGVPCK